MPHSTSIGLDVHAKSIAASALVHETGEVVRASFGYDPAAVAAWAAGLPQPCRAVYESGPTGFDLMRALCLLGLPTVVGAVTKMLRPSGDRVKTDRRDADFLARMLAVGNVVECWCPTRAQEADRDLARLREQAREDLMRARHRLSKFLLRKGLRWDGATTWTRAHREWLRSVELPEPVERLVYGELLEAVAAAEERRRRPRRRDRPQGGLAGARAGRVGPLRHARRLHPHRLRGRRRGGRPLQVPDGARLHVLRRARPVGVVERRERLPGRDNPGRQRPRQEAARGGRVAPREAALAGLRGQGGRLGADGRGGGGVRAVQPQAPRAVPRAQGEAQARRRHSRRGGARAGRLRLGGGGGGAGRGGAGLPGVAGSRPPGAGRADGPWGDPRDSYAPARGPRASLDGRQPPAGESECASQRADVRLASARPGMDMPETRHAPGGRHTGIAQAPGDRGPGELVA